MVAVMLGFARTPSQSPEAVEYWLTSLVQIFIPLPCQDSLSVVPSHVHQQHLEICENANS